MTFASSENAALRCRVADLERERDAEREWAKGVGDCVVAAVMRAERAEARVAELEAMIRSIPAEDCAYGDGCPPGELHRSCRPCELRKAMAEGARP